MFGYRETHSGSFIPLEDEEKESTMELTYVVTDYRPDVVQRSCAKLAQQFGGLHVRHTAQVAELGSAARLVTLTISGQFSGDEEAIQVAAKNLLDPDFQGEIACDSAVRQLFDRGRWADCLAVKFRCPVDIFSSSRTGLLVVATPNAEANVMVQSAIDELISSQAVDSVPNGENGDDLVVRTAFEQACRQAFGDVDHSAVRSLNPATLLVLVKWICWRLHWPDPDLRQLRIHFGPKDLIDWDTEVDRPDQSDSLRASLVGTPISIPFVPSSMHLKVGLRPIIVDGANVAMEHGTAGKFQQPSYSFEGIYRCASFWMDRGHTVVVILRTVSAKRVPHTGQPFLQELERIAETDKSLCAIVQSSKRRVKMTNEEGQAEWKWFWSYDDNQVMQHAESQGGAIVSNDRFLDIKIQRPQWRKLIEERLVKFQFDGDKFVPFVYKWGRQHREKNLTDWHDIVKFQPGEAIPSMFIDVPPPPPGYQEPPPFNPIRRRFEEPVSLL